MPRSLQNTPELPELLQDSHLIAWALLLIKWFVGLLQRILHCKHKVVFVRFY